MAEESQLFQEIRAGGGKVVNDLPKFELESYISNYDGILRLWKLRTIALTSPPLALEAFRLLTTALKSGLNVELYLNTLEAFSKHAPSDPLAQIDTDWIEATTRKAKVDADRLEHELKTYKNNLIKESIRMGQEDLGSHLMETGDYPNAFKSFSRMREFCTSQRQIAQMTFKLLYVSMMQRNWVAAASYQPKIGALQLSAEDKAKYDPILYACVGLAHLQQSNYRDSARAFLNVDQMYMTAIEPQGGVTFQKMVLTPNDVAIYGGLCALATMDRAELQRRVLDNASFRPLLELEPHIRRAISMFCSSKYTSCLQVLESYMPDYLLDYYLQDEFLRLYAMVRGKCIVQWFSAYARVTFAEVEQQFPNRVTDVPLEDELRDMIRTGELDARIDLVDKLLVSPQPNPRISVITDTLAMAKQTEHALRLRLHSINMRAAGFVVKNPGFSHGQNSNLASMMGEPGSEFFNGAMGVTTRGTGGGKGRRGAGGGGAAMV